VREARDRTANVDAKRDGNRVETARFRAPPLAPLGIAARLRLNPAIGSPRLFQSIIHHHQVSCTYSGFDPFATLAPIWLQLACIRQVQLPALVPGGKLVASLISHSIAPALSTPTSYSLTYGAESGQAAFRRSLTNIFTLTVAYHFGNAYIESLRECLVQSDRLKRFQRLEHPSTEHGTAIRTESLVSCAAFFLLFHSK